MTYSTRQKFNPRGGHMGRLTVKRDWPSTWVFFNHFGYFECKYESVISLGCPVLLGGYLEGRLAKSITFILRDKNLTHVAVLWTD